MAIGNVWVFAQGKDGVATSATLELLTKARGLAGNVTAFVAGDASSFASQLGEYGAQKVYATADLDVLLADHVDDNSAIGGIERRRRLVEQQDRQIGDKAARDIDALLLAAREGRRRQRP